MASVLLIAQHLGGELNSSTSKAMACAKAIGDVTVAVFAESGQAVADAAATLIANAIDLPDHPAITRAPADSLSPDSDLGTRQVTTQVPPLPAAEVTAALDHGAAMATKFAERGLIVGACLACQGQRRMIGTTKTARTPQGQPKDLIHA